MTDKTPERKEPSSDVNIANIVITQVKTFVIQFSKEHPIKTTIILFGAMLGIWWTSVQLHSYYSNLIYRDKIFISLAETGKTVNLNRDFQVVRPINPIKENTPTTIRFKLQQLNTNAPTITKITLSFPPDVIESSIKSLPAENGWEWKRTSDADISYYLDYPANDPPAKSYDGYWLPAFTATFRKTDNLTFHYGIIADKIEPIKRTIKLDPNMKQSDTFTSTFFASGNNGNSATPNTVSITPVQPLRDYVQGRLPTVTTDAEIQK